MGLRTTPQRPQEGRAEDSLKSTAPTQQQGVEHLQRGRAQDSSKSAAPPQQQGTQTAAFQNSASQQSGTLIADWGWPQLLSTRQACMQTSAVQLGAMRRVHLAQHTYGQLNQHPQLTTRDKLLWVEFRSWGAPRTCAFVQRIQVNFLHSFESLESFLLGQALIDVDQPLMQRL